MVYYGQGSRKLLKAERPDRFVEEKFLAGLTPHRLIYIMDRPVFNRVQGMHKISPDRRVTAMTEPITARSAKKPNPLETWGGPACRWYPGQL